MAGALAPRCAFLKAAQPPLRAPPAANPAGQAGSCKLPAKQDPAPQGRRGGCCVVGGVGVHSLWGTSVLAAGPQAQGQASGGQRVLQDATSMCWDPAGSRDAGASAYIALENLACVCQHICQS